MSEQRDWFTDPAVSIWAQSWFREKMAEKKTGQPPPFVVYGFTWQGKDNIPVAAVPIDYPLTLGPIMAAVSCSLSPDQAAYLRALFPIRTPRYPKSDNTLRAHGSLHARRRRGRR